MDVYPTMLIRRFLEACSQQHLSLHQTQELMGSINNFYQLGIFTRFFKHSGNKMLSKFGTNKYILILVPEQSKKDVLVICITAEDTLQGLPILSRISFPPLSAITLCLQHLLAPASVYQLDPGRGDD